MEKAAWPWHSCIDPSSLTSGQFWQVEPCPLWLFADPWCTHREKTGKGTASNQKQTPSLDPPARARVPATSLSVRTI